MRIHAGETVVAVGMTGTTEAPGTMRFVGVTSPLTETELGTVRCVLVSNGVVSEPLAIQQVTQTDPNCTMIIFSDYQDGMSPGERTLHAQRVGGHTLLALSGIREGNIRYESQPVPMIGSGSTPFNPNAEGHRP